VASAHDNSATARRAHEAFLAWIGERAQRPAADREPSFLARGMDLAQQRRESLSALMRVDPSTAIDLALPEDVRALLPASIRDRVETHFQADGDLLVVAVLPGGDSPAVQYFARVDGSIERAYVAGAVPVRTQTAIPLRGIRLGGERIVLRSQIEPAQATAFAAVLGGKRFLYMRVDFSDAPGHPETQQAALNLLDSTVAGFFSKVSYGKMSFTADSPPGVLRMPHTAAEYQSLGQFSLLDDARVVAKAAGFDTANYDYDAVSIATNLRIIIGPANAIIGGKPSFYEAPVSQGTFAHELGHNFGSVHANMWVPNNLDPASTVGTSDEYGNGFDIMGIEAGGSLATLDYNVVIKTLFGWLGSADILPVTASGTYHLTASDASTSGGVRALKIAEGPGLDYWVEYRSTRTIYSLVKNGAMVVRSPQNGSSSLLEMNVNGPFRYIDAPLSVGQTFFDPAAGVTITPVSKTTTSPQSMDVVVNFGPFTGNQAPTGSVSASNTTTSVGTNLTFTATVSDADGDPLVYHWTFGDESVNPGTAKVTKSFATTGYYPVRCAVSDMRGSTFSRNVLIKVGTPSGQTPISGAVTLGGAGLEEVVVTDGLGNAALTDTAGAYALVAGPGEPVTATPRKTGFSFSPSSTPVNVGTQPITGINFAASCATGACSSDGGVDAGPDATVDAGADAGADGGSCKSSTGGSFVNTPMTSQTGTFTAELDASVSASVSNTVIGLSHGSQSTYTGFSALARFNTSGLIDAYDGTTAGYHATTHVTYVAGAFYHLRLVVDVAAQTYSVFVTPPGQAEQTIASGFTFRTSTSSLTSWAINAHSGDGTGTACNFTLP
jgi:hypothetical protein